MASKASKMTQYLNYRMKVTIQDGRMIVGTFLAFDKHMNLVISDADEVRVTQVKGVDKEEKRSLGLTLIRGETVIAMTVDGPPPVPVNPPFLLDLFSHIFHSLLLFLDRKTSSESLHSSQAAQERLQWQEEESLRQQQLRSHLKQD